MRRVLGRLVPVVIGGGARLVAAAIGLVGTTLAARGLGSEGWGTWALLFAAFGWAQHLAEFGLRTVGMLEAGRVGELRLGLLRDLLRTRAIAWLVTATGFVVLAGSWLPGQVAAAAWLALALAMIALNLDWAALVRGRPVAAALATVTRPLAFLVVLLLLPRPLEVLDLARATCLAWAATAMVTLPEWRAAFRASSPPARSTLRLLRAGLPFGLVTLTSQLVASIDLVLVGWILGAAAAGMFGIVLTLAQTATLGAQAAAQWWLARTAQLDARAVRRALADTIMLGIAVGGAMALLGPFLVRQLFGADWAEAARLVPLAGLWVALAHPSTLLGTLLLTRGKASHLVAIQMASLVVTLPLQLLIAQSHGLAGAILVKIAVETSRCAYMASAWSKAAKVTGPINHLAI